MLCGKPHSRRRYRLHACERRPRTAALPPPSLPLSPGGSSGPHDGLGATALGEAVVVNEYPEPVAGWGLAPTVSGPITILSYCRAKLLPPRHASPGLNTWGSCRPSLSSCPYDCDVPPGLKPVRGLSGSSFLPEKTHIELACVGPAVGFPLPVISPAKAAPALAPVTATAPSRAASVDFLGTISILRSEGEPSSRRYRFRCPGVNPLCRLRFRLPPALPLVPQGSRRGGLIAIAERMARGRACASPKQ